MRHSDTRYKLNDNARCSEKPVGNHNMPSSKIYARNIFSPIRHKQEKSATDTCSEQNGRANDMHPLKK